MKLRIFAAAICMVAAPSAFAQTYVKNGVTVIHEATPQRRASRGINQVDLADAGVTAARIAMGATELNPIIGIAGNAASPLVAIGVKYAARELLLASGASEETTELSVGTGSAFGTGLGLAGPLGGALVGFAFYDMKKNNKPTTPQFQKWHDGELGGNR